MVIVGKNEKTAIVHRGRAFSYKQLLEQSARYAAAFEQTGKPKIVLLYAENSAEWIFAFYGSMRTGAITVPIDVQSTAHEVAYIINDCKPDVIYTTESRRAVLEEAMTQAECNCPVITDAVVDEAKCEQLDASNIEFDDENRTLLLIYTSGTTGSPKGVMLSLKNVMFNINAVSQSVKIFTPERNTMILLPLHHIFPLLGSLVAPLYVGQTVYIAEGLNAESILKTLNEGKINIVIGVPRLYELLTNGILTIINKSVFTRAIYNLAGKIGSKTLSKILFKSVHKKFGGHIDFLVSGGAALPQDVGQAFKTLGFTVLEGYGMTETAPMISFTRPWNVQVGYAGEPLPNIEVKITENGEVCVKGDNVMQGYYNRPDETAAILVDGWLHTGDTGELSPTKGLKLTGRIKEIIVTPNGKNINPEELERDVMKHTNLIKEIGVYLQNSVLQCVIVPQMSELRDRPMHEIERTLKETIATFNQTIAPYKRIKTVHIISGELPKTRLMKVQRFKLPQLVETRNEVADEEEKTHSEIYVLLKKYLDKETKTNVREHDDFEIDLAMDSLGKVALLTFVETSFGVTLNEAQLDVLNTLGKLSAHIEQHQHQLNSDAHITWKEILSVKLPDFKIPKPGIIQSISRRVAKLLMIIVYRYKKRGVDIREQPCIIVANHRSMIDGHIILSKLNRKMAQNTFFFAKDKHLRKSKIAMFLARKNNVILMDINRNVRESLQQMAMVLREGKNVIIFPEGTRTKSGELLTFKDSFAILSEELNVPVVPVVIKGAERAFFNRVRMPRFFAKITVEFLAPVKPQGEAPNELRDKVQTLIAHRLNE